KNPFDITLPTDEKDYPCLVVCHYCVRCCFGGAASAVPLRRCRFGGFIRCPDYNGRLRDIDVQTLQEVGRMIRENR
ncbi:MAG: hypothetical protein LBT89_00910, partial [Planctomycetaceae bacterium]|nr:hypothetical protein [Planctomycetaceae bacterium]